MIVARVGSREFNGWTSISVSRGINRAASAFTAQVTDRPWRVRPGDRVQIEIDGELVVTGWIDAVSPSYDSTSHQISVSGRSLTSDLIDCVSEISPGQWDGRKIERIASELAAPFGVDVVAEADTGAPIAGFRYEPGATIHDEIERLAQLRGVLVTDDERGRLVITQAPRGRMSSPLIRGRNILAASGQIDMSGRFSKYRLIGQQPEDEHATIADVSVSADADDTGVGRLRTLSIVADTPMDQNAARERVRHEAALRFGKSARVTYTVAGWRDAAGDLWQPNRLVAVEDDWISLGRDMLIEGVELRQSDQGEIASINLVRPDAYRPLPESTLLAAGDQWADIDPKQPLTDGPA